MNLASYLRELRANTSTHPRLGRSAIMNASQSQLAAWLRERNQALPKSTPLAGLQKHLLKVDSSMKPLTQREIAGRARIGLSLVNKAFTSGKKIRGNNLKKILTGMGYSPDSQEVRKALSIWASETGVEITANDVEDIASDKHKELAAWWKKVVPHLLKMTPQERESLAVAASRPAVVAALPALNRI
jgi:hypothetical protein